MNFENATFWVFYDGQCLICRNWARRFSGIFAQRHIGSAPLQDAAVRTRLGLAAGAPLVEMKVLTRDGRILGGVDGLLYIARAVWWLFPLPILGRIPPCHWILERVYRWFAAHRTCLGGACRPPDPPPGRRP